MNKPELRNGIKRKVGSFIVPNVWEPGKRFQWLAAIITDRGYTIGAEIGSANGRTMAHVMNNCPGVSMFAVDLWSPVPRDVGGGTQYRTWNFAKIKRTFDSVTRHYQNRVHVLQGVSWEMAQYVKDGFLDFIFIDADHEYQSVKNDIIAWTPKLKPGGMISGHDTHFEGVFKAVSEMIPNVQAVGIDHCWVAKKEDVQL